MHLYEINGAPVIMEQDSLSDYDKRVLEAILVPHADRREILLNKFLCRLVASDGSQSTEYITLSNDEIRALHAAAGGAVEATGDALSVVADAIKSHLQNRKDADRGDAVVSGIALRTFYGMRVARIAKGSWRSFTECYKAVKLPLEQYLHIVSHMTKNDGYGIDNLKHACPTVYADIANGDENGQVTYLLTDAWKDAMLFDGKQFGVYADEVMTRLYPNGDWFHILVSIEGDTIVLEEEKVINCDAEPGDVLHINDVEKLSLMLGAYSAESLFQALQALLSEDATVVEFKVRFLDRLGIASEIKHAN